MKRKLIYLLLIPLFSVAFQSCNDKKDKDTYAEWREANEAFIEKIKNKPEYEAKSTPQGPGTVYCKVLKEGNGGKSPIFTSKVKVYYKGSLIDKESLTVSKYPFDDSSERLAEFVVKEVVAGFSVALQNMQVGDKWEVVIPWRLGYGSAGKSPIPPYSALIFEIDLVEISQF